MRDTLVDTAAVLDHSYDEVQEGFVGRGGDGEEGGEGGGSTIDTGVDDGLEGEEGCVG